MDTKAVDEYVRIVGVDPLENFRTALERNGCDTTGPDAEGQYTSNCPAHPDARPSLRWTKTSNHVIKFHCLASCSYGDVMARLGLRAYQLRPVRYDFDYFDRDSTYRYTVRRTQTADDTKKFVQLRRGSIAAGVEDQDGSGLADDEAFLWLEPSLEEFAEDCRAKGVRMHLWLPEGEKDVVAVAGSGSIEDWEFVTTAPQGAGAWKQPHTNRLIELWERGVLAEVTVVADADPAGMARAFGLRDTLAEALPDLGCRVLTPIDGADVADLCDQYGKNWTEQTRELSESEIVEAIEEGTEVSGHMLRVKLSAASRGRRGMAITSDHDKEGPQLVIAAEIEPTSTWHSGWIVRITAPRNDPYEVVINRQDLTSKANFDRWLVNVAHIGMVPRCGISAGEVAQALSVWLEWNAAVRKVPVVTVSEHLTWVDSETGEPAKNCTLENRPVWIDPDLGTDAQVRWIGTDRAGSHWGREGTETQAAWAMARALTFGDDRTVAAVAGWAGAMILAPWLTRWTSTKPGLAVVAPSGAGKTHGAARLILQLIGCDGGTTSSIAGLRRRLAQGGVSAVQWIDDSAILDDHHLKEILRVATSQSEHVLANPDGGATATNTAKLVGCVVISAEGVAWAGETAMQDRFLFVRPDNPQKRTSIRPGHEDELQWADVQELRGEFHDDLTSVAGIVVDGLADQSIIAKLEEWATAIKPPKSRNDVAGFVAALGARAVAMWLYGAKARAGDAWPGNTPSWSHERYNRWGWLVKEADELLAEARDSVGHYNALVSTVLPAVLHSDLTTITGKAMTGLVIRGADASGPDSFRNSVHRQIALGDTMETAMPPVLIDTDERIWVWAKAVATWYARVHRREAEARINGPRALTDQLEVYADNPDWATHKMHKDRGRSYDKPGFKVGKRGSGNTAAVYQRLSDDASRAVFDNI